MKNILFFIAVLSLASCSTNQSTEEAVANEVSEKSISLSDAQLKSAGLITGTLEQKRLSNTIKANGKIDVPPQNLVSVSVPLGGYLKSTKLLPGMHLKKGEVIAVLEDQQYIQLQENYLVTKTKLEVAEAEYIRQMELNQSKASSDKVLQQAKGEFQLLKIAVSALAERLDLININPQVLSDQSLSKNITLRAPFDGFVSKVNVNVGKYVTPADVLFELVDPSDIHLNLKVFEKDLIQISIGQKVIAYTNTNPEKLYESEIILIGKDISPERTAEVHCHFDHFDKNLLPGMYMNAEIEVKSTEVYAVEEKAIVSYEGADYLFVVQNDSTFEMVEASFGNRENGWAEVKNHNAFKEKQIVTQGAYTLLMGLKNKAEE
jgi:cobalt-zinc-cadmium efflux system membrane fusion protein